MPQSLQWHRGEDMGIQKLNREKKQISNSISSVLKPEAQKGLNTKGIFSSSSSMGETPWDSVFSFWRSKTR